MQGLDATVYVKGVLEATGPPKPPGVAFFTARDRIRILLRERLAQTEPLNVPDTNPGTCLFVEEPETLDTVDVERLVLLKDGNAIPPLKNDLKASPLTLGSGGLVLRHSGFICWPPAAFDPTRPPLLAVYMATTGRALTRNPLTIAIPPSALEPLSR
jgi:hypothetical protein